MAILIYAGNKKYLQTNACLSYFCELENMLLEAFKGKDYYYLFSHHYKLRNPTAFGTTTSLLPMSQYGFFLKTKKI